MMPSAQQHRSGSREDPGHVWPIWWRQVTRGLAAHCSSPAHPRTQASPPPQNPRALYPPGHPASSPTTLSCFLSPSPCPPPLVQQELRTTAQPPAPPGTRAVSGGPPFALGIPPSCPLPAVICRPQEPGTVLLLSVWPMSQIQSSLNKRRARKALTLVFTPAGLQRRKAVSWLLPLPLASACCCRNKPGWSSAGKMALGHPPV